MKTKISFFFLLLCAVIGQAQTVQWASKVLAYSSQNTANAFSAKQVLGAPNVLPAFFESANAWTTLYPDNAKEEFIRVGFEQPMQVRQVAIAESYNAGSITKVILIDMLDKEYQIYENLKPGPIAELGRLFKLKVPLTKFKVKEMRIVFDSKSVTGFSYIDAIGISDSETPITVTPNLGKDFAFDQQAEALPSAINSEYDELMPVLSSDGKVLYFSRLGHPDNIEGAGNQDIWFSAHMNNGQWSAASNLGQPLNNEGNNVLLSTFNNGQNALLLNSYGPNGEMGIGLSIASLAENGWINPRTLDVRNYYNRNTTGSATISPDGQILLLSLKRDDSYGGNDIYVSFQNNGSFSEPRNLGKDLNTVSDEYSPSLAPDGKHIFFATMGRPGYGSSDIYVAERLDDTWQKWSEPENLGPNVNTAAFESQFCLPQAGNYAFFTRKADILTKHDIYQVLLPAALRAEPMATVTGKIFDSGTKKPMEAYLSYSLEGSNEPLGKFTISDAEATFRLALPVGKQYKLVAKAAGYLNTVVIVDLRSAKAGENITQDLPLKSQE